MDLTVDFKFQLFKDSESHSDVDKIVETVALRPTVNSYVLYCITLFFYTML